MLQNRFLLNISRTKSSEHTLYIENIILIIMIFLGVTRKVSSSAFFLVELVRFKEELLSLPLLGIQIVLSSDYLQINSEDVIYDFALKWSCMHYPGLEAR